MFYYQDEIATAHSLALSLDGGKLYTGFNRMIRVFDVSRPGRHCIQRPTFGRWNTLHGKKLKKFVYTFFICIFLSNNLKELRQEKHVLKYIFLYVTQMI